MTTAQAIGVKADARTRTETVTHFHQNGECGRTRTSQGTWPGGITRTGYTLGLIARAWRAHTSPGG